MNHKKYIPFVQQRYCCVPACLQMVLYRRGIPLISQEDIGYELGLIVPEKDEYLFERVRTGRKPAAGWGTQISKSKYSLNGAFRRLGIDVEHTKIVFPESVSELTQVLGELQQSDNDGLICFNYGELWNTDYEGGHVCLFESVNAAGEITIIDPEHNVPKRRVVSLDNLFNSMIKHGSDNSAGIWILE